MARVRRAWRSPLERPDVIVGLSGPLVFRLLPGATEKSRRWPHCAVHRPLEFQEKLLLCRLPSSGGEG